MVFTRWKLITGVIGLSAGGFATLGGGTPPPDSTLMVRAEEKLAVPPPPVVTAPVLPPSSPAAALPPSSPVLPPSVPVSPPSAPSYSASTVPSIDLPALPLPESKPAETKLPPAAPPTKPMDIPVLPASGVFLPETPIVAKPTLPPMPPPASLPDVQPIAKPTKAVAITPVEPSLPAVEYLKPATAPAPVATAALPAVATIPSKFRIVLRVGAGEPTFEVRHDDDLVMKVVCEKVDIKSPEKGQGPSNVVATGKVRFVGFGAEGTCDSFSFLAGTGEVSLSGNVNVKVRDKIGRVESELNADKMQYKLDQTALTGVLKP